MEQLLQLLRLGTLLFRRKNKLKVDLGEMQGEREQLSSFLRSSLKVDVTSSDNELLVDAEKSSTEELKAIVNRFVYHRNLNNTYWVALESGVVRINKFKGVKKQKKRMKEGTQPSIITHGW
jgi:non-canonical (house-cleaning) NTP pyrophosphatase